MKKEEKMGKGKAWKIAGFCILCSLAFCGCGQKNGGGSGEVDEEGNQPAVADSMAVNEKSVGSLEGDDSQTDGEDVMRAMVLRDPAGRLYFIGTENGAFFTASMPDSMKDAEGNAITESGLQPGNIVDITGNGIMLESYPGQYPGVTDITVVSEGSEEDARKYQELIDSIYTLSDPSEPPSMNVEYKTELALTTVMLTRGNYEWSYVDEENQEQTVIACGNHILESEELNEANLEEPTDLSLYPSKEMESVEITRWTEAEWIAAREKKDAADIKEGEKIDAVQEDGIWVIHDAEPGYVYLVTAQWEEGYAEFGFYTGQNS